MIFPCEDPAILRLWGGMTSDLPLAGSRYSHKHGPRVFHQTVSTLFHVSGWVYASPFPADNEQHDMIELAGCSDARCFPPLHYETPRV